MRLIKSAMNKVCSNIEQKGVAQLLQIEEVRLKSSRRCGFSQSPHAQEASILLFVSCKLISILMKFQDTASLIGRGAPRGK